MEGRGGAMRRAESFGRWWCSAEQGIPARGEELGMLAGVVGVYWWW